MWGKFQKEVYTSIPASPPLLKLRHNPQQSRHCTTFKVTGWKTDESCISCSFLDGGGGDRLLLLIVQRRQFRRPLLKLSGSVVDNLSPQSQPDGSHKPLPQYTAVSITAHTALWWRFVNLSVSPRRQCMSRSVISGFSVLGLLRMSPQANIQRVNKWLCGSINEMSGFRKVKPVAKARPSPCVYTGAMWPNRLWTFVYLSLKKLIF